MASEKDIHDRLQAVQSHLLSLRSTTSAHATADLTKRWAEVEALVKQLSSMRTEQGTTEADHTGDAELSQRVDALIEDVVPMFVNFWSQVRLFGDRILDYSTHCWTLFLQSGKVSQEMYPGGCISYDCGEIVVQP